MFFFKFSIAEKSKLFVGSSKKTISGSFEYMYARASFVFCPKLKFLIIKL